jgi:hypothetical protein
MPENPVPEGQTSLASAAALGKVEEMIQVPRDARVLTLQELRFDAYRDCLHGGPNSDTTELSGANRRVAICRLAF